MIDSRLAAFIEDPVMMVLATRSGALRPAIARGVGARPSPDRRLIDVFVSGLQWPQALEALAPGDAVAFTACRPATYETYQVKGPLVQAAAAGPDDLAWAERYCREVAAELSALGIGPRQIATWLTTAELRRVRFEPQAVFDQTPGPKAGDPVREAAP